ncbi:MAG: arsenate reductase ArsC [Spirochaetia bacterium]|nr:arsenate reductase ArsC [Spirochaetia bacterium]
MGKLSILFLCTGNSCRSQMAESIVNTSFSDMFIAYSAGSKPDLSKFPQTKGVHPMALRILEDNRMKTGGLASKSWDPFIQQKENVNFVFTLCGNALDDMAEACPIFPGQPVTAHWGLDDPALATGTDEQVYKVFQEAFALLKRRIDLLANLPLTKLKEQALQQKIDEIGRTT